MTHLQQITTKVCKLQIVQQTQINTLENIWSHVGGKALSCVDIHVEQKVLIEMWIPFGFLLEDQVRNDTL